MISLDDQDAEARYLREPADSMTAERLFERRWAMTVLDRVMKQLREDMLAEGKADLFDVLKNQLSGAGEVLPFAEAVEMLGISEGAARVAAHRLKKRYRQLLRDEIAQTVVSPTDVDDEIRYLVRVLSGADAK